MTRCELQNREIFSIILINIKDRWINDSLNESFEVLYDECPGQIDPRKLIEACKTCLDELALTCDECALEMTGRRPQITAQCR